MAFGNFYHKLLILPVVLVICVAKSNANDILGCGGFVKSHVGLDYSKIEIGLYTKEGILKEKTECAPTNGYYFLPLYEKGEYVLKVHPPAGWSFEPSQVELSVDGVADKCTNGQDINFKFNGFGITGKVITAGQQQGPSGINVQLVNGDGEERRTVTTVGGDFHFTPVIPGKYTLKASHPRWKLDPVQAVVQVKEGNTVLPTGVLAVRGYDVSGTITSFGGPIGNLYVLLYSKEESPKFRVEGCNTALLQGVPDSPICHVTTDASGQFTFGVVPAGEYSLRVMSTTPGQPSVTYNVKPEVVPFTVQHDSLFIKNAFEVTSFNIVGTVSSGEVGLRGVRVALDGAPVAVSDAAGAFTLPRLAPGRYTVSFQHERCEIDDEVLEVGGAGPLAPPRRRVARWRVCGSVAPPAAERRVALAPAATRAAPDAQGKWCTFLAPGVYTAKVELSEKEQSEGLQFYPLSQKVTVSNGPVEDVNFSQLTATLTGRVECKREEDCVAVPVTLRPLGPDGSRGAPMYTTVVDGQYKFSEVLPGTVEVSVSGERLCWEQAAHVVAVAQAAAAVPAFRHVGHVLRLHASHRHELEYSGATSRGVLAVPAGASRQCVPAAEELALVPRGCHLFRPARASVRVPQDTHKTIHIVAVAHEFGIKVTSPLAVADLTLTVDRDGASSERVGPLPCERDGGACLYSHTLHLAEGEVVSVSASSSMLLFSPAGPVQALGGPQCQPAALTLRARAALTLRGRVLPPVADVTVTLTHDDVKLSQVTSADGTYVFGPLDASKSYKVAAEKESYVFSEPDENGDIQAHKLAEIVVTLVDDVDSTPLQGGLVSVSGGSYRRNAAAGASGALRFPSLAPGEYYVKPNMKEFRFTPPHTTLLVQEGKTHTLTLRGERVAWSCLGSVVSLGGAGWPRVGVQALVRGGRAAPHCRAEVARTDLTGEFRIRGLLPGCQYELALEEATVPELRGLKLIRAPAVIEVKDKRDITRVVLTAALPAALTDAHVWVRAASVDHYKTLRLALALETSPDSHIYSAKLDPTGFSQHMNPGLMYVLPRLPADNKTYVLALESILSKATHSYQQQTFYFNSDGKFKHFTIDFAPKVVSGEQELRQSSLLVLPLLALLALAVLQRDRLAALLPRAPRTKTPPTKTAPRAEVLDKASIDSILNTVNPPKKAAKKKFI